MFQVILIIIAVVLLISPLVVCVQLIEWAAGGNAPDHVWYTTGVIGLIGWGVIIGLFVYSVLKESGSPATAAATTPAATGPVFRREAIPEHVRHEVWRRDEGRCVDCGSRERLEFDHIIPVSRGGSNTTRNIELRCEVCNRAKGAVI